MGACASVASRVNEQMGCAVSTPRIDSVVLQAGQHIRKHESDTFAAQQSQLSYFIETRIGETEVTWMADELTAAL